MKIKEIKGLLPEEKDGIHEDSCAYCEGCCDYGFNEAQKEIGEKEIEIDATELMSIILKWENENTIIPYSNILAQAIAKECPIRVKD